MQWSYVFFSLTQSVLYEYLEEKTFGGQKDKHAHVSMSDIHAESLTLRLTMQNGRLFHGNTQASAVLCIYGSIFQ